MQLSRLTKGREAKLRNQKVIGLTRAHCVEVFRELDAVRADLAHAIEQYDAMKDSRDAAKLEGDELRAALARCNEERTREERCGFVALSATTKPKRCSMRSTTFAEERDQLRQELSDAVEEADGLREQRELLLAACKLGTAAFMKGIRGLECDEEEQLYDALSAAIAATAPKAEEKT